MAENKINETRLAGGWSMRHQTVPPGCAPAGRGAVSAWVPGVPAPQGSKRYLGAAKPGGRMRAVESSKILPAWRADVRAAFESKQNAWSLPGAMVVKIVFVMPRPVATPKTKPTPPAVKKPDLDKLVRAVLDALKSAGVYADDSQVVTVHAHKRIAELGEATGAMIHVEPVDVDPYPDVPRRVYGAGLGTSAGVWADGGYQSLDAASYQDQCLDAAGEYDTPASVAAKMRHAGMIRDMAAGVSLPSVPNIDVE